MQLETYITEVLKDKLKTLYNSVKTSDAEMQCMYSILNNGINWDQLHHMYVTTDVIAQCIITIKKK